MTLEAMIPDRMSVENLTTGTGVFAQFNPDEVDEKIGVSYNRLAVQGLSHQPMQYQYTENMKISLTLGFEALSKDGGGRTFDTRKFMLSLLYAGRNAQDIIGGEPPRVLFIWPQLYSIKVRITSYSNSMKRFALNGRPTSFSLKLDLEWVLDSRMTSEDIYEHGTQFSGSAARGG